MPTYDPILDNDTPSNKQKYWDVAFGLQAVDGLHPSPYVQTLAAEHVNGTKSYAEVTALTHDYYEHHTVDPGEFRTVNLTKKESSLMVNLSNTKITASSPPH